VAERITEGITREQVQKMMASGQSESQAVDSIKRIQGEMKRNPKLMLQPQIVKNGRVVDNPDFKKEYGDFREILKKTHSNVGRSDDEQRKAMDKELADRKKHRLGEKYSL